ncbi:MAG: fluoride efflux transporter CrcB [Deltaproteobacteria bacterium]|nr:fluoride efflux transporter CrcB [Deltaproteobacteria bacterium]
MKAIFLVGSGGFVGAVLRYLLARIPHLFVATSFPLGTMLVNILGSFGIGYFLEYAVGKSFMTPSIEIMIAIGLLGGFTTFSSFSFETISLLKGGHYMMATSYILLTNILCIGRRFDWVSFGEGIIKYFFLFVQSRRKKEVFFAHSPSLISE